MLKGLEAEKNRDHNIDSIFQRINPRFLTLYNNKSIDYLPLSILCPHVLVYEVKVKFFRIKARQRSVF